MKPDRFSLATVAVLQAIADGVRHGFDIMDATGLASGTVYPILSRLERAGLVTARWEPVRTAQREKRPQRRYYELAHEGVKALAAAIAHYRSVGGLFPDAARGPSPSRS